MKISVTCLLLFFALQVYGQTDTVFVPKLSIKAAPAGLLAGNVVLQGEYNFGGRQSLTVKFGFPKNTMREFQYDSNDVDFDMKAMSFLAGYRMYFSKRKHMKGFYWEPYFQYVHHSSEGTGTGDLGTREVVMRFSNDYNAAGVGVQLGVQFLIRNRVVVDLYFLGPQINAASNNLKAVEVSNTLPWTEIEKRDAETSVKDFIDQFPFIRNRTTVKAEMSSKTVTADFRGPLPGIRAGISFGVAF